MTDPDTDRYKGPLSLRALKFGGRCLLRSGASAKYIGRWLDREAELWAEVDMPEPEEERAWTLSRSGEPVDVPTALLNGALAGRPQCAQIVGGTGSREDPYVLVYPWEQEYQAPIPRPWPEHSGGAFCGDTSEHLPHIWADASRPGLRWQCLGHSGLPSSPKAHS